MERKIQHVQQDLVVVVVKAALCDLLETQGGVEYPQLKELLKDARKQLHHLSELTRRLLNGETQGWESVVGQSNALPGSP